MKITTRPFLFSLLLLAAALLLSVAVGSVFIPPAALWALLKETLTGRVATLPQADTYRIILGSLRLPRTLLVAFTGAALAASGGAYQGLFRNPLADPYVIGVASGAGLGAVLAITVHWMQSGVGIFAVPLAAFAGALLAVGVVYQLARVGRAVPTTTLILAGVAVSSFCTALSSYLMLNSTGELRRALIWQLGGTTLSGWSPVLAALPYLALGCLVLLSSGHALNVLQFGDEQARQLGLPVERVRGIIVLAATLTTAAAVAFSGVIGFVGLVVPHLVRMIWGGDYRRLLPLALICGAAFLLFADVLARTLMAPQELPVGVITSLAGAPFFLWVLRRNKQQSYW